MANPTPYQPSYDFAATDKGALLNVELQNIAGAVAEVIGALADVRRADGKLQNRSCDVDALDPMVLTQFSQIETNLATVLAETVAEAEASAEAAATQAGAAETSRENADNAAQTATAQAVSATASAEAAAADAASAGSDADTASAAATNAAESATAAAASATAAAASATGAAAALAASRFAFSARKSVDQTGIVTATATKVDFPTEIFDFGSYFDVATSRYTPPAGRYRLSAGLAFSAGTVDGRQVTVEIWKNGAVHRVFAVQVSGVTDSALVSGTCLVEANGTDYFEVYATAFGVGDKTISNVAASTFFEGEAI